MFAESQISNVPIFGQKIHCAMASKIILKTGFSPIVWLHEPRDSSKMKGEKLFDADHVLNVQEIREANKQTQTLKAKIKAENEGITSKMLHNPPVMTIINPTLKIP